MRSNRKKEAGLDNTEATNSVEAKEFPEDRAFLFIFFSFVLDWTFSRSRHTEGLVRLSRKKE